MLFRSLLSPPVSEPAPGGALGPSLGLAKSSSLESLLTAVSEASHDHASVPFHRPRPNMARARACNQSFRFAIDRSYDGPSEDGKEQQGSRGGGGGVGWVQGLNHPNCVCQ